MQNLSGRSSSKLSKKLASLKRLGDSSRANAKVNPANFLGQFLPTSTFVAQICWHLLSLLLVLLSLHCLQEMLQRPQSTLKDLRPTMVPLRSSFLYRSASDLACLSSDSTTVLSQAITGSLQEAENNNDEGLPAIAAPAAAHSLQPAADLPSAVPVLIAVTASVIFSSPAADGSAVLISISPYVQQYQVVTKAPICWNSSTYSTAALQLTFTKTSVSVVNNTAQLALLNAVNNDLVAKVNFSVVYLRLSGISSRVIWLVC